MSFYPTYVERPRLLRLTQHEPRVILIIGLPSSGKSTVLEALKHSINAPYAMLRLASAPNDSQAMLQAIGQQLGLASEQQLEQLLAIRQPTWILIDDLDQLLDAWGAFLPEYAWLTDLLENPALHVVATSLAIPQHPMIQQWIIRQQLLVIGMKELAFSSAELIELAQKRQLSLNQAQADQLIGLTEGWVAPCIFALNRSGTLQPASLEWVMQDVMGRLPAQLRNLLEAWLWLASDSLELLQRLLPNDDLARLLLSWEAAGLVFEANLRLQPLAELGLRKRSHASAGYLTPLFEQAGEWYLSQQQLLPFVHQMHRLQRWDVINHTLIQQLPLINNQRFFGELVSALQAVPVQQLAPKVGWLLVRSYHLGERNAEKALILVNQLLGIHQQPDDQRMLRLLKADMLRAQGAIREADSLIQPYLNDPDLAPDDQARVLRTHAIYLASLGQDDAAIDNFERAYHYIEGSGINRLLGLILGDYANAAARAGRYSLADRLLRQATSLWDAMAAPAGLSQTLNLRALVALHQGQITDAARYAQQAYDNGMIADQRAANGAMVTLGDVALAERNWTSAIGHYRLAREQLRNSNMVDYHILTYALALESQATRHGHSSRDQLQRLLLEIDTTTAQNPLDQAWLAVARSAANLSLKIDGTIPLLQRALAGLDNEGSLAKGLLYLLLSEAFWQRHELGEARQAWKSLDELIIEGRSGLPILLSALTSHLPELVHEAYTEWNSPFAARVLHDNLPAAQAPTLVVRLMGQLRVEIDGKLQRIPRQGILLIALLLLNPSGMTSEELRENLWGIDGKAAGWRKMLERTRKVIPECVVYDGSIYRLGIPLALIDADILVIKNTHLQGSEATLERLQLAADYASQGFLPGCDAPWIEHERQVLIKRGAELWVATGIQAYDQELFDRAQQAFDRALQLEPLNERAVALAMNLAIKQGRRTDALKLYADYRKELDDQYGIDPSAELQALQKRALD
ncbi:BTAD domain-containing putative transcriptional regulator [Herpetosiphon giganteus]|uniref:BTAD domain-containing putative transcriptional regulator n=1 Tax=Herpetosiphon giganteus TaxID=2029754 RepID=UPI00195CB668|nr:BTAD domain-containing putative transcriptional regulator [Herpetosiphon giganteus]MBM7843241.1 DNA-binding SARP family transcriptional activator [Herpetosiphon giganteus]